MIYRLARILISRFENPTISDKQPHIQKIAYRPIVITFLWLILWYFFSRYFSELLVEVKGSFYLQEVSWFQGYWPQWQKYISSHFGLWPLTMVTHLKHSCMNREHIEYLWIFLIVFFEQNSTPTFCMQGLHSDHLFSCFRNSWLES